LELFPKILNTALYLQPVQRYGQFCICAKALWMQEIKPLFNSLKTLIVVFEFAMYLLALKIKFKNRINFI
jgi:hypothetical protein